MVVPGSHIVAKTLKEKGITEIIEKAGFEN